MPTDRPTARSGTVPAQPTPLIGREAELQVLQQRLLQSHVRLLTLVGPGGVGKTRLALALLQRLHGQFRDGARFIDLSPLHDAGLVVPTIAHVLGIHEAGGQPVMQLLIEVLRDRTLLLVLDNFEHLLDAAAGLAELLSACPDVKLLVTSREPLRLRWEHLSVVPPLGVPDTRDTALDAVRAAPAVTLFLDRARAADASFALTGANAATIATLCRRLDGLPLALELAAARVRTLSPQMLLDHLDRHLDLLRGARDAPPRQQSLRATLNWSYQLLSQAERRLFDRLCVFAGGCSIEAAETVCAGDGVPGDQIVELLTQLVDKSLVVAEPTPRGSTRYRLLDTLRAVGLEHLAAQRELEGLQTRQAAFCVHLAEEATTALLGPDQANWLDNLEREHDNLRAALRWAYEQRAVDTGARLAGVLGTFWDLHGHLTEGRQWAEAFLRLGSSPADLTASVPRTAVLRTASRLALAQGDLAATAAFAEEGLACSRASGDRADEAVFLLVLGHVARLRGEFDRAATHLESSLALHQAVANPQGIAGALEGLATLANWQGEDEREATLRAESLALFRSVGAIRGTAVALFWLGELACRRGEYARAAALDEECLAVFRSLGDERSVAGALAALGDVTLAQGTWQQAATHYGEALELSRRLGDREGVRRSIHGLACAAAHGARPECAARLLGAAEALAEALGVSLSAAEQRQHERSLSIVQKQVSRTRLVAAWAAGRALSIEEAVAEALAIRTDPERLSAVGRRQLSREHSA